MGRLPKSSAEYYRDHFKLAAECGRPLSELVGWRGPMTHRQFRAWGEWKGLSREEPGLLEHYVMLLCSVTANCHSKTRTSPADFKLVFKVGAPAGEASPKEEDYYLKRAIRRSGGRVRIVSREEAGFYE